MPRRARGEGLVVRGVPPGMIWYRRSRAVVSRSHFTVGGHAPRNLRMSSPLGQAAPPTIGDDAEATAA
jgi:hypothetical protein